MRNPEPKREKEKERKQQKGTHGLSFVPGKASVDVDRESGCEVNGGHAETRRESLECPISCPTRYPHLSLCCSASLFQAFFAVFTILRLCPVSLRRHLKSFPTQENGTSPFWLQQAMIFIFMFINNFAEKLS